MRCPTCKLDTLRPIIDGPTGRETGQSVCLSCAGAPQPGVVHLTPTANRFAVEVPPELARLVSEEAVAPWSPFELSPAADEVLASASGAELVGLPDDGIRTVEQVDAIRAALGVPGLRDVATPEEIAQHEATFVDELQARFDRIPDDAEKNTSEQRRGKKR